MFIAKAHPHAGGALQTLGLSGHSLTLRTWAQKGGKVRSNHMAAVGAEEEILTPGHQFELVAFMVVGTSFGLHGPWGLKSPDIVTAEYRGECD